MCPYVYWKLSKQQLFKRVLTKDFEWRETGKVHSLRPTWTQVLGIGAVRRNINKINKKYIEYLIQNNNNIKNKEIKYWMEIYLYKKNIF